MFSLFFSLLPKVEAAASCEMKQFEIKEEGPKGEGNPCYHLPFPSGHLVPSPKHHWKPFSAIPSMLSPARPPVPLSTLLWQHWKKSSAFICRNGMELHPFPETWCWMALHIPFVLNFSLQHSAASVIECRNSQPHQKRARQREIFFYHLTISAKHHTEVLF